MSNLELKNEMHYAINFCCCLGKIDVKTFMLVKVAFKEKCFYEFMVYRWHDEFKKRCLSAEVASKSG